MGAWVGHAWKREQAVLAAVRAAICMKRNAPPPPPPVPLTRCRGPGTGLEVAGGPMVGRLPQGPGQDPRLADSSPAAQLAAMLRCAGPAEAVVWHQRSAVPTSSPTTARQRSWPCTHPRLPCRATPPPPARSGIASGVPAAGGGGAQQDAGSAIGAALLAALARQQHGARMAGVAAGPSLADVLRPDVVAPLLADEEVRGWCGAPAGPGRGRLVPCF
jgi:hypothetical protein